MAFGMKQWSGWVAMGCALLAVAQLPPDPFDGGRGVRRPPLQEEFRYRTLRDEVLRSQTLLRRIRWSDSLPGLLAAEARDGWTFRTEGTLPPGPTALLQAELRQSVEQIPDRRADVLLGAFVQRWERRTLDATHPGPARDVLFGRRDGVPYCIAVDVGPALSGTAELRTVFRQRNPDGSRGASTLGICRWIAELGLPGPHVTQWLRTGGSLFGEEASSLGSLTFRAPWNYGGMWRRGPFGLGWQPSREDGCLAGLAEACADFFIHPTASTPTTVVAERRQDPIVTSSDRAWFAWRTAFGNPRWATLLGALYEEFGRERTEAFWTSESEVPTAFRDAFQVEVGAWVAGRVRQDRSYVPRGPLPRLRGTLWALLLVAACGGVASVAGTRRRV